MRGHKGRVNGADAVEFLLFEARFPRSLRYCVRSAVGLTRRMAAPEATGAMAAARTRLAALDAWLDDQESKGIPLSMHELLTHVVDEVGRACGELRHGVEGATELIIASRDRDEVAQ